MNPMAEGVDWVQRAAAGEEARKSQSKASQSQPENFPVVPVLALTARSTQQAAEARAAPGGDGKGSPASHQGHPWTSSC